ncbi:hypothetical protein ASPCADRAFT_5773 [Aspergillus carbonarius ITEM 5010]|uniref:Uncharacterized protein n=1 Tax=Aspergillus carbonarius (strain ITEM 5010) TaxID=602072 RepID=A0A1R3RL91_ASPC5|nr:hypothetical protein ASPCADRAFT_5773 [Aspergillus carbonarius ITEM 5010]
MPHHLDAGENPTPQLFGLWSAISLGWLTLNVFGGVSFIMFVGLSAGGLPAILYGFVHHGSQQLGVPITMLASWFQINIGVR